MNDHTSLSTRSFVDVHTIQDELDQVRWGLHGDGEGGEAAEHAAAEARASVLNLIAVVGNEAELGAVSNVLDRLSVTNPSRTLILLAQHTREADKLEAEVSAQERTESGHRVSTERVLLHAHGEPARHLASLATPLFLWSQGYLQEAQLFALFTLLLWIKHRPNIARLAAGTEEKIGA